MLDLTEQIKYKLTISETSYKFDEDIIIGGDQYYLTGSLEFELYVKKSRYSHENPQEVERQYVINITDDLSLFDTLGDEVEFIYDDSVLNDVFEIS